MSNNSNQNKILAIHPTAQCVRIGETKYAVKIPVTDYRGRKGSKSIGYGRTADNAWENAKA